MAEREKPQPEDPLREEFKSKSKEELLDLAVSQQHRLVEAARELENEKASRRRQVEKMREKEDALRGEIVVQKQENDRMVGYIQRIRDTEEMHRPRQEQVPSFGDTYDYVAGGCRRSFEWWKS